MLVNNGKGCTVMAWALCKACCVVRGAAVQMGASARGHEYSGKQAKGGMEAMEINGNNSEVNTSLLHS
jgi:hypothetical protein